MSELIERRDGRLGNGQAYLDANLRVLRQQLFPGGIRLASLLNAIFERAGSMPGGNGCSATALSGTEGIDECQPWSTIHQPSARQRRATAGNATSITTSAAHLSPRRATTCGRRDPRK